MKRSFPTLWTFSAILSLQVLFLLPYDAEARSARKQYSSPDVIRWDFENSRLEDGIPSGWEYKGKMGTPDVTYALVKDADTGEQVLKITSKKATGVLLRELAVNFEEYPWIRWRWKAGLLPSGADARVKSKDDQGIALYIGYGTFRQKSISYTWETMTPKNATGKSVYNGLVTVFWTCLRNQDDPKDTWVVEQRNVLEDLKKYLGKYPSDLALSISCNSQYTGTNAVVYLDYIEFRKAPLQEDEKDVAEKTTEESSASESEAGK